MTCDAKLATAETELKKVLVEFQNFKDLHASLVYSGESFEEKKAQLLKMDDQMTCSTVLLREFHP